MNSKQAIGKRTLTTLLLGTLVTFGASTLAESAAEPAESDDQPAQSADSKSAEEQSAENSVAGETQPDETEQPASVDSPEIFIPSEEISEDFAVSFPVDI